MINIDKKNMVKILGSVAVLVGFAVTQLDNWVKDQEMNEKIDIGIKKALAERESREES